MIQTADHSLCCGCGACEHVCARGAIKMASDREGFLYPSVDTSLCVDCGACSKVCPLANVPDCHTTSSIFAAVAKDEAVTRASSSGGVFKVIADRGIGDGGIVYGAVYDDDLKVVHTRADDEASLSRMQGSKYVQSNIRSTFGQVAADLREGRTVLFSGTPCQVAAIKLACKGITCGKLLTVDFICHGVPSPGMFEDFKAFAAEYTHRSVKGITMRDKRDLRGFFHSTLHLQGKELYDKQIANLWLKMYFSELISRPSCHTCPFARESRVSDITLADFWGGEKAHGSLFALGRGVSLCLVNTEAGERLLPRENLLVEEGTSDQIAQPCLHSPAAPSPRREEFWAEYDFTRFDSIARKWWGFGKWNIIKRRIKALFI